MKLIIFLALLITSCTTPYGPRGLRGGYEDSKVSKSTYKVSFLANGHSTPDEAKQGAYRRAKEICAEHRVIEEGLVEDVRQGRASINCTTSGPSTTCTQSDGLKITWHEYNLVIRCKDLPAMPAH